MRSYCVSESLRTERNYYDPLRWRCVRYAVMSSGGGIGLFLNDFTVHLTPGEIDELMTLQRDGVVGRWTWRPLRLDREPLEAARLYALDAVPPAGARWGSASERPGWRRRTLSPRGRDRAVGGGGAADSGPALPQPRRDYLGPVRVIYFGRLDASVCPPAPVHAFEQCIQCR